MNNIPNDILVFLQSIKGPKNNNELLEDYYSYDSLKDKHNKELDLLYFKANNFSLQSILNNPKVVNYNEIVSNNKDAINILSLYQKLDEKLINYLNDYNLFVKDYELILQEYSTYLALQEFVAKIPDLYIDDSLVEELNSQYILIISSIPKDAQKYYNFSCPNELLDIDKYNAAFIEKHINDTIFNDINGKSLDREQRIAVLSNPNSNLTIAGAGSGKTLTICGKIKYLIEELKISPSEILLLSYSNKSTKDLETKVNAIYPNIKVNTFHSLGLEILKTYSGKKYTVDDSFNAVIEKFFREELSQNIALQTKVLNYYGLYLSPNDRNAKFSSKGELFEEVKKNDFRTLKEQMQNYNQSYTKIETIKKELVKSFEELAIANYLFINGIDYEYESSYKEENTATIEKRQYTPDFYLPQYNIYYEHYGIDKNGNASQYTLEEAQEYVKTMEWKRELHKKNNTKCIETFSHQFQDGTIFEKLEKLLIENGVKLTPLNKTDINNAINSIYDGQSFRSFINLIRSFISLYKSRYESIEMFDKFKETFGASKYEIERRRLFLDICKNIYQYYLKHLKEENKIDFDDMILKSTKVLSSINGFEYKYIIVDEFQDISYSRMQLLIGLVNKGKSKIFAVGDDWQAIYRFSGCDINLFINFDKYFNNAKKCFITSTHRNSQELQNIAEPFIVSNPEQFKKNVKSNIHLNKPIKIMYFNENKYNAFMKILEEISKINKHAKVLLLGRNNKDIELLESNRFYREQKLSENFISKDYPEMDIKFITVHASKGLEEEFVVIINADDAKQGFPNKIEDDPMLNLVLSDNSNYEYAEERRLWYVALTRTKTYAYILANTECPSTFLKEIESKCDIINPDETNYIKNAILCPNCKTGRLIIRDNNTNYKRFYGCSNFPYCRYTNNDIKQVNDNHRCKNCGDFMTFRRGPYGSFWGCRNYPNCTYKEEYIPKNNQYTN